MVSLKLDRCMDRPAPTAPSRPRLVLQDMTEDSAPPPPRRRSFFSRMENFLLAAAAAAALLFFFVSFAASLFHSVQRSYESQALPSVVIIPKTVARGDTLTRLASRYGDPNTYILAREDQIVRANHLSGTAPLVPGQHLQIPVTNPTVIARIVSQHRLVASR